ncbi:MAG: DUF6362 family protein [Pseudomonadota bacterium]|nr:DUF6362 family protein [Pseudomonadota bacterium]
MLTPLVVTLTNGTRKEWYTPTFIRSRLEDAADTLKRLPAGRNAFPAGLRANWPPIVRNFFDAYGRDQEQELRIPPQARAITRMDEVLLWLNLIEQVQIRRIVFARALGMSLRKIGRQSGLSHEHVRRLESNGLETIATMLNRQQGK